MGMSDVWEILAGDGAVRPQDEGEGQGEGSGMGAPDGSGLWYGLQGTAFGNG